MLLQPSIRGAAVQTEGDDGLVFFYIFSYLKNTRQKLTGVFEFLGFQHLSEGYILALTLADYSKFCVECCKRVGANPDIEVFCVLDPLASICAPVTKLSRAEFECDRLRFTGREGETLKAFQGADGT